MKQLITTDRNVQITDVPTPTVQPDYVLVKTMYSAISPGTELSIIENSMNKTVPLGYSAMGVVEACGSGIEDVKIGDFVACYGAPYVQHSEYMLVPKTLYAKVPEYVEPKEAALAGIGAIAIHALRIAKLEFGETVIVAGLGLLGQMIARIADAASYNVVAYDIHEKRANMLFDETGIKTHSNEDMLDEAIQRSTNGNGADAVLLCAGGKRSPLTDHSLTWIRNKGKVVIVGDIEPEFPRSLMFRKEAEILISRAGGPGRYDQVYEKQAIDYPYGFVRWTEGRNLEEYIRLVGEKRINVHSFITEEVNFNEAPDIFRQLQDKKTTTLTKIINY